MGDHVHARDHAGIGRVRYRRFQMEILHDLLVDPQQRLTLGSVCKDEFGLAVDLYMGGKARAARAENTGVADQFIQLHPVRLR